MSDPLDGIESSSDGKRTVVVVSGGSAGLDASTLIAILERMEGDSIACDSTVKVVLSENAGCDMTLSYGEHMEGTKPFIPHAKQQGFYKSWEDKLGCQVSMYGPRARKSSAVLRNTARKRTK